MQHVDETLSTDIWRIHAMQLSKACIEGQPCRSRTLAIQQLLTEALRPACQTPRDVGFLSAYAPDASREQHLDQNYLSSLGPSSLTESLSRRSHPRSEASLQYTRSRRALSISVSPNSDLQNLQDCLETRLTSESAQPSVTVVSFTAERAIP